MSAVTHVTAHDVLRALAFAPPPPRPHTLAVVGAWRGGPTRLDIVEREAAYERTYVSACGIADRINQNVLWASLRFELPTCPGCAMMLDVVESLRGAP